MPWIDYYHLAVLFMVTVKNWRIMFLKQQKGELDFITKEEEKNEKIRKKIIK